MSISSENFKTIFVCNGSTVDFDFDFKVFDEADLEVILYEIATGIETVLTLTTHYATSLLTELGGRVTTVATYSSAYKLIVRRKQPKTQDVDYTQNDEFSTTVLERQLDEIVMMIQELDEMLNRGVFQDSSQIIPLVLPIAEGNKVIGWNTAGTALENKTLVTTTAVRGTFTDSDLAAGVLTLNHNLSLTAPYALAIQIYNNSGKVVLPDEITGGANAHTIDLSSFGTLSGTWGYVYL